MATKQLNDSSFAAVLYAALASDDYSPVVGTTNGQRRALTKLLLDSAVAAAPKAASTIDDDSGVVGAGPKLSNTTSWLDGRLDSAEASIVANASAIGNSLTFSSSYQYGSGTPSSLGLTPRWPGDVYEDRSTSPYTIYEAGKPTAANPNGGPFEQVIDIADSTQGQALAMVSGQPANVRVALAATTLQTIDYTAAVRDRVMTDLTAGSIVVKCPASPAHGDSFEVVDAKAGGSWDTNAITINGNGFNVNATGTVSYNAPGRLVLVYDSTGKWSCCFIGRTQAAGGGISDASNNSSYYLRHALGWSVAGGLATKSQITATTDITGVVPIANLATGTPSGAKFVRDDGTLAVPAGGSGGLPTGIGSVYRNKTVGGASDFGRASDHITSTSTKAFVADTEYHTDFLWLGKDGAVLDMVAIFVTTAGTGGIKVMIFNLDSAGWAGTTFLAQQTLTVGANNTHIKADITSGPALGYGFWYRIVSVADNGTTVRGLNNCVASAPLGTINGQPATILTRSGSYTSGIASPPSNSTGTPNAAVATGAPSWQLRGA